MGLSGITESCRRRFRSLLFAGFLPSRANARRLKLEELSAIPATLIFYEAPHRIAATLADALEVLGNRLATVARELTKVHEEIARGSLRELVQRFGTGPARGEIVLVISGAGVEQAPATAEHEPASRRLIERVSELELEGVDARAALKQAARELGIKRDEAYRLVVAQKNRRSK